MQTVDDTSHNRLFSGYVGEIGCCLKFITLPYIMSAAVSNFAVLFFIH